ncbi:MAG: sigma-70 family RNA polymerase sigma factor [Dehalococcoidia bacterium]
MSAERLVQEAQAFSQEAWAQIHDDYYTKIFDYCYIHTGDRPAAEDLASEVFLEALRGIRRYEYRGLPITSWLYRIARNLTADHLQRNSRRPTVPLVNEAENPRLQVPDASESSANWHDIRDALAQLTADQRQVIILRFFQNLSHDETAAIMKRRPGAVRVLQSRALNAMRRLLTAA